MEASKAIYEKDFVENLLPQKFPFVMVDKCFRIQKPISFQDFKLNPTIFSFPTENSWNPDWSSTWRNLWPCTPVTSFFLRKEAAPTGYIGSIKEIQIAQLPELGDEIQTTVTILQEFAGITLVDIVTNLNRIQIASGQMKTILAQINRMEMEPIDIKNYLPHRAPMLMCDLILKMDNEIVETTFEIKEDNIFLQNGIFLEAGLIENAAQTCSSIVAKSYYVDENNEDKEDVDVIGFISAIKTLKIHGLPKAGRHHYYYCDLRFPIRHRRLHPVYDELQNDAPQRTPARRRNQPVYSGSFQRYCCQSGFQIRNKTVIFVAITKH